MSPASTDCLSSWLNCTLTGLHRVAASMIVGRLGHRLPMSNSLAVNAIAAPKEVGGSTPLVKNAVVATSSPTPPRITHGPRFDAVLGAIREAESAVHYTSFDQPSAHVWSEQERTGFASALGDLSARLLADPSDRSMFSTFESIGPSEIESDTALMEAIIGLDLRIGNLEEAESTLFELAIHLADLEDIVRSGSEASVFETLTSEIFDAADRITAKLVSGDYLTEADVAIWNDQMSQVAALGHEGGPRRERRAKDRWLNGVRRVDADISRIAGKDTRDAPAEASSEDDADIEDDPTSLLEQLDAELAVRFRALGPEVLRRVASSVATGAVHESALRDPRLAILEDLDDRALVRRQPRATGNPRTRR